MQHMGLTWLTWFTFTAALTVHASKFNIIQEYGIAYSYYTKYVPEPLSLFSDRRMPGGFQGLGEGPIAEARSGFLHLRS
ncbi:uncharacterized protein F4822DRAFT_310506 [Hypoxylon trugodes]|uniref:uncharacterized protein n=1 Tax=Hypoxylon trugodes TaxID=326681 RepID=UPI002198A0ED|nr:uncharacterized protein F4822DRAFT_310506 [Hypoxylon trugodes]KAI1386254.1 hypothetical protein F4822DRAFT_310506 [Hypoxylon trugodes]